MGYVPNQAARQLRRRRSDSIGYILPSDRPRFSDPFFAEFVAGLGDEAAVHGFDLLVSTAPPGSPAERQAYERWTQSRKVDGIVLNRIHLHDWRVQYLAQVQFPFVTLERSLDSHDYPSVEVDGRCWYKVLVDHLVSLGHQRIAYVGASPDLKIQTDRFDGYQEGLQCHGLSFDADLVVEGNLTSEGGYRAAERLHLLGLPQPTTAIACVDDMTAIGVLHAARERGWTVGKDLAVAGFDGIEGFEHTQPPADHDKPARLSNCAPPGANVGGPNHWQILWTKSTFRSSRCWRFANPRLAGKFPIPLSLPLESFFYTCFPKRFGDAKINSI